MKKKECSINLILDRFGIVYKFSRKQSSRLCFYGDAMLFTFLQPYWILRQKNAQLQKKNIYADFEGFMGICFRVGEVVSVPTVKQIAFDIQGVD